MWKVVSVAISYLRGLGLFALGLVLVSCTGTIQPVGGLLDTNMEDLPDQVVSEDEDSPIIAAFKARNKAPSGGVEVVAVSSDTNLLPHPTITLNPETEEYSLSMIPTGNGSGIVTVTITVTLGTRVKVKKISVTVTAVNRAPEIEAIADVSLTQGSSLTGIDFDVSDLETAAADLTVAVSSNNQTLLPNANITLSGSGATRSLAINPVASQLGVALVTVTVTDAGGLSSTELFNVTVSASGGSGGGGGAPNTAPTISAISDQTISEDGNTGALSFTVGDTEQAANTLVVTAASSNTTLVPLSAITLGGTGASRNVLITPPANLNGGPVTITLTVSDGTLTTDEVFTVTVNSVNDAPTISFVADQAIDEDTNTGALAFTIGDVETAVGTLGITLTSDNTTVVPNANLTLGGSGANRTITVTPAANQNGLANISIEVSDGSTSTAFEFQVAVDPVNDAPTISTIADQNIASAGTTGALAFTIADVETAVGSLTVTRATSNTTIVPLGNVVLGGSGANRTVSVTGASNQWGTLNITVTVGDGTTTTDEVFQVTVDDPDQTYITFTYPHKNGFKVGESDDSAYTLHGTCAINGAGVDLSVNSGAVTGSATCTSNEWSHTFNLTGLSDGTLTVATTNVAGGANVTRTLVKETSFCDSTALDANPFPSGDGTKDNAYTICSPGQFDRIRSYNSSFFSLKNNIGFTAYANWNSPNMTGGFEGNNFQIKNFTANTAGGWKGLFSLSSVNPVVIRNFHSYNVLIDTDGGFTGSFFNRVDGGGAHRLYNISARGSVTAQGFTGGLFGDAMTGNSNRITAEDLHFDGTVTAPNPSTANWMGGLIGQAYDSVILRRASSRGSVAGNSGVGGLSGYPPQSIEQSWSSMSVTAPDIWIGGLLGLIGGSTAVTDSYSWGAVTGGTTHQGGAFGENAHSGVQRVYSTGAVTGSSVSGGLGAGCCGGAVDSFWDTQTSGQDSSSGGTGLTTAQMQNSANFTNWDFTNVWQMNAALSAYPTLRWQSNAGAPTITAITDRTINEDGNTGAIAFTIGDETVAAGSLTLTAYSSNTTLVPNNAIALGGSGANRTVTVTPEANLSGTAWIFVDVSDGSLSSFTYFKLTVSSVNDAPVFTNVTNIPLTGLNGTGGGFGFETSFEVSDVETASGSLILTTSTNGCIQPNEVSYSHAAGNEWEITFASSPGFGCNTDVTIQASDGTNTTTYTFHVEIGP